MMRYLFVLVLIVGIGGAIAYRAHLHVSGQPQTQARPPAGVVVTEVVEQQLEDTAEALATVRANESVTLTASVTERVIATHFNDGDVVKTGQLLLSLNSSEALAELRLAEVQLAEQEREYRRIAELVAKKTIASSELDRIQSLIDAAHARVAAAQAKLAERAIHAPFGGQLGLRQVSRGTLVTPGTVITTLDDLSKIKIDFMMPERFLASVRRGNEIQARSDAYPDKVFKAKVATIEPRINAETRAVTVRAEARNRNGLLHPGMLLKLRLVQNRHTALVVPEEALLSIRDQHFVFVVDDSDTVHRRRIQIGMRKPGLVEVIEGLAKGERVITRGQMKAAEGEKVIIQQESWRGSDQA